MTSKPAASSASIPLTLISECADLLAGESTLVLVGFGVGLTWSAVALRTSNVLVAPLTEI